MLLKYCNSMKLILVVHEPYLMKLLKGIQIVILNWYHRHLLCVQPGLSRF